MDENKVSIVLYKNWKFILFSTLFIGATALVVSFFIAPKYKSIATIYPPSSNSLDAVLAKPEFGYELQADRMIQMFDSEKMKSELVEKFNLIDYYELDTSENGWRYQLNKNYGRDIEYKRTKYLSVVVMATTKDPVLSADLANYLVDHIDAVRSELFMGNMYMARDEYQTQYDLIEATTDSLLNLIYSFSVVGDRASDKETPLFELRKSQIENRREKGAISAADNAILNIPLENQSAYVDKVINEYYFQNKSLNEVKQKLQNIHDNIKTPMPNSYVISKAEINDKKVSPSKLINTLIGLGIGFLLSVIISIFKSKISSIKKQLS